MKFTLGRLIVLGSSTQNPQLDIDIPQSLIVPFNSELLDRFLVGIFRFCVLLFDSESVPSGNKSLTGLFGVVGFYKGYDLGISLGYRFFGPLAKIRIIVCVGTSSGGEGE